MDNGAAIAIIDYGMGNLRSVQKALQASGADTVITQDPDEIARAGKIVLPGVGAMRPAMDKLAQLGLIGPVRDAIQRGRPFLGICLGYQLLFESSLEGGVVQGLGLLPGTVERFTGLKVPHMGWNQVKSVQTDNPLLQRIPDETSFYFCHSFYARPAEPEVTATLTDYGVEFASSVWKDRLFGVQFHPEKSQQEGLQVLKNFVELAS